MRIDKLAMTSREALQTAMSTAADAQAGAVEPIHLLSALLGAGERNISVIIERIGADPAQLARSTQDAIDRAPKVSGEGQQMGLSNELVRVIEKAEKKATKMGDSFVVTEHLLMALAEDKGEAGRVLRDAGVTKERIEQAYEELRGDDRVTSAEDKTQFEALEQYGRNICGLYGTVQLHRLYFQHSLWCSVLDRWYHFSSSMWIYFRWRRSASCFRY